MEMQRKKSKKRDVKSVAGRYAVALLLLLLQAAVFAVCVIWFSRYVIFIFGGFFALSLICVIAILNSRENPSYKLAWIIPILLFPVVGVAVYFWAALRPGIRMLRYREIEVQEESEFFVDPNPAYLEQLGDENPGEMGIARYLSVQCGHPVYRNTDVTYLRSGEEKFARLKEELRLADKFIFIEYYIVESGTMWEEILDILKKKAAQGVEVRVMYDGTCEIARLPYRYHEELQMMGIKCKVFSPVVPILSAAHNNRDHRKIVVIDGHTAFTGGINLADEYININSKYGHWKDVAVRVKGEAAQGFCLMFLQMWNTTERRTDSYRRYLSPQLSGGYITAPGAGYVIPYGDNPHSYENVGEQVYLDMLYRATKYVHIMNAYMVMDNEMMTAMIYAAKRGVDVKIILPGISDNALTEMLAHSYYQELLEAGVELYEYTPGFVHAKSFVSDDIRGVVGTINLDYRSLYLNYECAAYIYGNPVIQDIEEDFQETLKKCKLITLEMCREYPLIKRGIGSFMRLFAPLM